MFKCPSDPDPKPTPPLHPNPPWELWDGKKVSGIGRTCDARQNALCRLYYRGGRGAGKKTKNT